MPSSNTNTHQHRHKRPFQPPITSFFSRGDRDVTPYGQRHIPSSSSAPPLQGPVLSNAVQASLLSVGMRIRKAVPEGYKTHKTLGYNDGSTSVRGAAAVGGVLGENVNANVSGGGGGGYGFGYGFGYGRQGELMPYCGLHKVGGLGVQQQQRGVDAQGGIDIFADETPFMSSQESNFSNVSTESAPALSRAPPSYNWNKRRFEDEENEHHEDHEQQQKYHHTLETATPIFNFNFEDTDFNSADYPTSIRRETAERILAVPRSRRRDGHGSASSSVLMQQQAGKGLDFEEAEFLVPWGEGDVAMDLEG
ncbi:hypothetical protein EJ08DRAFT_733712 [Tothia fuscella]|uniref:Uncharacterized protein n=1 Tax=Tothia fuscella TaxID=1048955 RepID=A0A9P4NSL5_9PEZI|nr:hypothetical protein EJ08DRAFT_733712 [Tothia fuscella]